MNVQLKTRHFGTIEVDEKDIIDFPEGILGFEYIKRFVILGKNEEGNPFHWLQGVDDPDIALVIIDPRTFKPDYVVEVPDEEVEILEIKDPEKVLVFSVVVVPEDLSKMTANLSAPILINIENSKGKQVVMDNEEYPIKYYFMEELRKVGG